MVSITVSTPGKPTLSLDFPNKHPDQVLIKEVKAAIHAKFPKLVANRQRLTSPQTEGKPVPLTDDKASLGSYGVGQGATLRLKDLGAQVPYRLLYVCEYIGVVFVNPAMLHLSHLWWGSYQPSLLQTTVRNLLVIHFVKRTLESAFLHSFSRPTVPLSYLFRNIAYYWGICGLLMGLTLYRPAYSASALRGTIYNSPTWVYGWAAFELAMEAVNLYTHLHLASLRTPPGTPRKFPTGFSFGTIVCANYFWETLGVLALVFMTGGDFGTLVYLAIAVFFMRLWASQKYRRYKKEFGARGYPGKRWVYFPPLY